MQNGICLKWDHFTTFISLLFKTKIDTENVIDFPTQIGSSMIKPVVYVAEKKNLFQLTD